MNKQHTQHEAEPIDVTDEVGLDDEAPTPEVVEEMTLTLRKPITFGEELYTELHLTEPTSLHIAKATMAQRKGCEVDYILMLASQTSGVPVPALRQLRQRDFVAVGRFFGQLE